jgi:cytochrome c-type biogenesis protein CcmE
MSNESRFDALLDHALEAGEIPADATPEERREIADLLAAAGMLRATSSSVDAEAQTSLPVARARFQRFLRAAGKSAELPAHAVRARPSPFRRILTVPRGLALVGGAIAIGLLAVALLFASQDALDTTGTVAAEVLEPGDYVQIDGVVSDDSGDGDNRLLSVQTEFGRVQVRVSALTEFVSGDAAPPARFRSGDAVTLSGLVGEDRAIRAQTVALGPRDGIPPPMLQPRSPAHHATQISGRVVAFALSEEGRGGRVLIDAGHGEHYLVTVDFDSLAALIRNSAALGASVSAKAPPGAGPGMFSLSIESESPASRGIPGLRGVIVGRDGNRLEVESPRGTFTVMLTPRTRIVLLRSGLDREAFMAPGAGIGHEVVVSGPTRGMNVMADVLALGPLAGRR